MLCQHGPSPERAEKHSEGAEAPPTGYSPPPQKGIKGNAMLIFCPAPAPTCGEQDAPTLGVHA